MKSAIASAIVRYRYAIGFDRYAIGTAIVRYRLFEPLILLGKSPLSVHSTLSAITPLYPPKAWARPPGPFGYARGRANAVAKS